MKRLDSKRLHSSCFNLGSLLILAGASLVAAACSDGADTVPSANSDTLESTDSGLSSRNLQPSQKTAKCCPPWAETTIVIVPRDPTAESGGKVFACEYTSEVEAENTLPVEFQYVEEPSRGYSNPDVTETLTAVPEGYLLTVSGNGQSAEFLLTSEFLESGESEVLTADLDNQRFVYDAWGLVCPEPVDFNDEPPPEPLPGSCIYVEQQSEGSCSFQFQCESGLEVTVSADYDICGEMADASEVCSRISCREKGNGSFDKGGPTRLEDCPFASAAEAASECAFHKDWIAALAAAEPAP